MKRWLGFAVVVAVMIAIFKFAYPIVAYSFRPMSQQFQKDQGYFFRFRAGFEVKETGEQLNFDYVVACNIRLTRWRDGGLSNDSTYSPRAAVLATRSGPAVMVRTLKECEGLTSDNEDVPPDVLPLAIWFDDVADLSVGIGYFTEDAYDNPLSKLKFHGARVDRASRADWEAWRKKAAEDYVQRGVLPGPWGYDFPNHPSPELGEYITSCEAYARITVPEEFRAELRELWPKDRPHFWTVPSKDEERQIGSLVRTFGRKFGPGELSWGQPIRSGQIVGLKPHVPSRWPTETYPLLWPGLTSILPLKRALRSSEAEEFVLNLDLREGAMNGFAACQDARNAYEYHGPDAPAPVNHVFEIDGVAVKQLERTSPAMQRPHYVVERDEAVFVYTSQGF